MNKVAKTLKWIGAISLFIFVIVGLMWFIKSTHNYNEYKDFIDGATANGGSQLSYNDYGNIAYNGKMGKLYSLIFVVVGAISSVFIYAYGEVINLLQEIKDK